MARYLLPTQTLFDIARGQNLPAERWIESASDRDVYEDDLFICSASIGRSKNAVQVWLARVAAGTAPKGLTADFLNTLSDNLDHLFELYRTSGRVVDADEGVMVKWVDLLADSELVRTVDGENQIVESAERLELATAAAGLAGKRYILLAPHEPFHARINGLVVEEPGDAPSDAETGR